MAAPTNYGATSGTTPILSGANGANGSSSAAVAVPVLDTKSAPPAMVGQSSALATPPTKVHVEARAQMAADSNNSYDAIGYGYGGADDIWAGEHPPENLDYEQNGVCCLCCFNCYATCGTPSKGHYHVVQCDMNPNYPIIGNPGDPGDAPRVLYPPEPEMRCWMKLCPHWMAPTLNDNCCQQCFGRIFVTPLTNITNFSLYYQLYLNEVFHTHIMTRISHYTFMPFVNFFIMVFLAQFTFETQPDNVRSLGLMTNGAMIYAIFCCTWWLIWGIVAKTYMLGVFMIIPMFLMWVLATMYYNILRDTDNSHRRVSQCTEHWAANPIIWMIVSAFGQAMGHVFECKVPPRVSGTAHWLSFRAVCKTEGWGYFIYISMTQALFGTLDEFIASPRLLPLLMLKVCYMLGYNWDQWKVVHRFSELALAYGDPALDYVGTGGIVDPRVAYPKGSEQDKAQKAMKNLHHVLAGWASQPTSAAGGRVGAGGTWPRGTPLWVRGDQGFQEMGRVIMGDLLRVEKRLTFFSDKVSRSCCAPKCCEEEAGIRIDYTDVSPLFYRAETPGYDLKVDTAQMVKWDRKSGPGFLPGIGTVVHGAVVAGSGPAAPAAAPAAAAH